jgi:hypothetical protein
MSIESGPNISNSGLILSFDAHNTQKSWKGKPITNLQLPNIGDWSGSAIVTLLPELSPIGTPVYSVTDNNASSYFAVSRSITVPNDSNTYCYSIYIKKTFGATSATCGFNYGITGGTPVQYNSRFNSDTGAGGSGVQDLGTWWRWYFFATNNSTGNTTLYCDFYPATGVHNGGDVGTATGTATVSSVQIEQNTFMSPFVNGTRSNTQSFIDLTGNNTLTATSLTYASDGSYSFNGSSDMIVLPENSLFNTQTPTVEVWVKPTSTSQNGFWFEKGTVNSQYALFLEGTNITWRNYTTSSTSLTVPAATYLSTSAYNQVVGTYTSGTGRRIYVNGVQVAQDSQTGTLNTSAYGCSIGVYGGYSGSRGYYYSGNIGMVRVYSNALTPAEVMQNFNSTRGRFGI